MAKTNRSAGVVRALFAAFILLVTARALFAGNAAATDQRHVVVVVWDGMRPDFVTEQNTPTLWKLGQEGVVFRNHHPVYFSATNVNGVALATGMYPAHSDLIANHEFRPRINSRKPVDVENPAVTAKGDELTRGSYIAAPTVAELVQKAGGRSVIAATKTVGLLHDRPRVTGLANGSVTLSASVTWPNDAGAAILKRLDPFPKSHTDRDVWTTRALTEVFWKDGVPPFSVLWLGQPDLTEHETAPGAPEMLRAVKSADMNLSRIVKALDRYQVRQSTDVFVVSDHGFSTIARSIDLLKILRDAGFNAAMEFSSEPKPGDIMVVGGGGSVLFYIVQHQPEVLHRLVEFLQQTDFAGVLLTREPVEGAFTLDQAKINSPDAPDAVMAFRWMDEPNQYGARGMIDADWQRGAGKGTHATLSRYDMHNMLIAAGPHFQRGQVNDLPSGNVDVAPTILQILQISSPTPMDGRVLTEALTNNSSERPKAETQTIEANRHFPNGTWRQTLRFSHVGATMYLDEGNGSFELAK